jgi:hypothetical protein
MAGENLRITGGPAAGNNIEVGQELQIGRSAGAEGRLGDDPEISRQHARISRNPQGQLVVEDLGSTNGTYVNGQRISGPTTLNPGDTVQMGRSTLSVEGAAGGGQATAIGAVPVGLGTPPPPAPPPPGPPTQALPPTGQQPAFAQGPPPPPGFGPGGPGGPGGQKNTGRIALIAGLIAAVIIGAVVLALVLSGGDDKKSSSTAAASTPTTFTMDTSNVPTTTESTPTETTTSDTTTDETTTEDPLSTYPPNVKEQFVKGCTNGGGSESACQCTIDEIEKKYDLIEFLDLIEKANSSGKFPAPVQKIIQKCANA